MKFKLTLSAIALALLPCLPAKADFFTAVVTNKGWWEVDTDSIEHLDNGTARFISRQIKNSQIGNVTANLIDCWNPRVMYLAFYNIDAQMWRDNPDLKWYPIKKNGHGEGIQAFVCSTPGR
ncbi:hypothetical protein BMF77_pc00059 (plasmid) [Dolichospermum sp. UHCC 0315A]|uniref:CNP1-like family protein n=1 Tax=Dolichospermum TaxID=748770 RepID=UPI0011E778C2|nr:MULTISPECIES: CNP1-like family protein [Dolichospermum]MDB9435276.1 CNP1-like family protein [Dolichospermum lemmermannii CS-548]QEI41479.1 hypothetical protein BMF77_02070 [Dolichospermum sp. UHCC 0315A]QEI44218.1 hypothetical protein BMF77_04849 [Dolichospermum sp. UHCC 0315A]QEI44490.1 hypothetical protein BMF77_pc00059 [Dolichospermum sp. UHCC 0315A]